MNDIDMIQQFRDHIKAGKRDANTENLIQMAQDLLPKIGHTKEGDELVELIQGMTHLSPESLKTWPGSSAIRM